MKARPMALVAAGLCGGLMQAAIACEIMGMPAWNSYCTNGARHSSSCGSGCATSAAAPMSLCCTDDCCGGSPPPPPPTPPTPPPPSPPGPPSACSHLSESTCYATPGCGYCISSGYDGDCLPGDVTGAFSPAAHDCDRQWVAGVHRTSDSMCVVGVSDKDVRCYKECTYSSSFVGETFVVPDQAACNDYDTAYKQDPTPAEVRKEVHEHIAEYLLSQAMVQAHVELLHKAGYHEEAKRSNATREFVFPQRDYSTGQLLRSDGSIGVALGDMTRDLLHSKIEELEKQGLEKLEEGACAYFTGGAGLSFCRMAFKSPMGTWLNNKIVHIPIVEHINNKLSDSVADLIPSGMRNGMNNVIDGYNKMSARVEPMEKFVSTCVDVGKKVANTLFGWL